MAPALPLLLLVQLALQLGAAAAVGGPASGVIWQDFRAGVDGTSSGRQNNWTNSEQSLVLALQGLANRAAPRLFLNVTDENMSYNASGSAWAQWISKDKALTFTPQYGSDLCQLTEQLTATAGIKGLVLYDDLLHRHVPAHAAFIGRFLNISMDKCRIYPKLLVQFQSTVQQ